MSADLQLLRPGQVAGLLGVHRCTLWRWIQRGDFPEPLRIGRNATAFRQSDISDWLETRQSGDSAGT